MPGRRFRLPGIFMLRIVSFGLACRDGGIDGAIIAVADEAAIERFLRRQTSGAYASEYFQTRTSV